MMPHAVRLSLGPDHRLLLPASALAGSVFVVIADLLARVILAPVEIPVGVISAIIGADFIVKLQMFIFFILSVSVGVIILTPSFNININTEQCLILYPLNKFYLINYAEFNRF